MASFLNESQVDDLLTYCGTRPARYWKDGECLVCCPVHGESHPSMGISIDKQVAHCFSCGFAGGFAKLLLYSLPDDFDNIFQAQNFLNDRYELAMRFLNTKKSANIKRYEELNNIVEQDRKEIPLYKISTYMSGKETYKYFFIRGFTKQEMKKFKIGRDLENRTVTIPVFYEDEKLAGVLGRYIDKNRRKNERYKIYNNFNRGDVLYPLNFFEEKDDTIILVEGCFDAIIMHRYGYTNTLAKMGLNITKKQADYICSRCSRVIDLHDNDKMGYEGREKDYKLLKGRVNFLVVDYPSEGKDVGNWDKETIDYMIENAHSPFKKKLKRM